jgi:hypothetical protein
MKKIKKNQNFRNVLVADLTACHNAHGLDPIIPYYMGVLKKIRHLICLKSGLVGAIAAVICDEGF